MDIQSVYKASTLGYTNFLAYQSIDRTIRGVNISWASENTTVFETSTGDRDTFVLREMNQSDPVVALGGTNLMISVVKNVGGGASLIMFFQEQGDDISFYRRDDNYDSHLWEKVPNIL